MQDIVPSVRLPLDELFNVTNRAYPSQFKRNVLAPGDPT